MYMFNNNQNCVWHPLPPPLNWIYVLLCVVRYCWSGNNFSWGSFGLKGNQLRRVGLVFFLTLHQNWILAPSSAYLSSWSSKNWPFSDHLLASCLIDLFLYNIFGWIRISNNISDFYPPAAVRNNSFFSTMFSKIRIISHSFSVALPNTTWPPWLHSKTMLCLAFLPWVQLSLS